MSANIGTLSDYQPRHSQLVIARVNILSLRCAPAEELTVYKEVSTSLSGYPSLRIRQEVSLSIKSLNLTSSLSQETFCEKVGLPLSSPLILSG